MLDVVLTECLLDLGEDRVRFPRIARRARLRELGQPHLEALVSRVDREEAVQGSSAGARQSGDEDRPLDLDVGVLRMLLPCGFTEQTCHQGAAKEYPRDLAAERRQILVAVVGLEQDRQSFGVIVDAEVRQSGHPRRRGVEILDGADVSAFSHGAPSDGIRRS